MYEFFQGVTTRLVCDNLKTGVISHPKEGEIVLTADYEAMGEHYMTAIMPAGVRKPKHKPSVEATVGKIATAIIAKLRNEVFYSFEESKIAVYKKLNEFNNQKIQKREHRPNISQIPSILKRFWFYIRFHHSCKSLNNSFFLK